MPRFLVDDPAAHVAGKAGDALLPDGEKAGAPMRSRTFQRAVSNEAVASVGLDALTPHALRHIAASLAIAAGADVKVVQQVLGHQSATRTLDLYGHLFPDRLDTVTGRRREADTVLALSR